MQIINGKIEDLYVAHSLATATSDFLVGTVGAWVKKTLAQTKTILGLSGTNSGDETTTTMGTLIHGAGQETTLDDTDEFSIWDSATGLLRRITWSSLKTLIYGLIYPVGCFYTQYPNANSNTDSTAFPTSYSPSTLFGGTWTAQWNTVPTFFCTQGNYNIIETQSSGRTSGLQTDQHQGHAHEVVTTQNETLYLHENIVTSGTDICGLDYDPTGDDLVTAMTPFEDGFHGTVRVGYSNRPQNRLIKVWKRTA